MTPRIAIALSTKDRVELTQQSIAPLLDGARQNKFDLFVCDGSTSETNEEATAKLAYPTATIHHNVRGGADAAIVYALSLLLNHEQNYQIIGLVENDVLLDPDWLIPTFELFEKGRQDGLEPGAVSPRCYVDRILVQRGGYAVCHNLGAGVVIFTRDAARLVLDYFRTTWTTHNRAVFSQLSGVDIGQYWAFKGGEHWLTADWAFDKVLASHGYASLALTPAKCQMIGQDPPLDKQGLVLADKEMDAFQNDKTFDTFVVRTELIRNYKWTLPYDLRHRDHEGEITFAHQLPITTFGDRWGLQWCQGFGPFAWRADEAGAEIDHIQMFGPGHILLNGGKTGGSFKITDTFSGFEATPTLQAGIMGAIVIPSGLSYRTIRIKATSAGGLFHGIQTTYPQPRQPGVRFDHSMLPGVGK